MKQTLRSGAPAFAPSSSTTPPNLAIQADSPGEVQPERIPISDYMEVSESLATNGSGVLFPRMAAADPNVAAPAREFAEAATWRKSPIRATPTAAAAAAEAAPSQSTSPGIVMTIGGNLGAAAAAAAAPWNRSASTGVPAFPDPTAHGASPPLFLSPQQWAAHQQQVHQYVEQQQ